MKEIGLKIQFEYPDGDETKFQKQVPFETLTALSNFQTRSKLVLQIQKYTILKPCIQWE